MFVWYVIVEDDVRIEMGVYFDYWVVVWDEVEVESFVKVKFVGKIFKLE